MSIYKGKYFSYHVFNEVINLAFAEQSYYTISGYSNDYFFFLYLKDHVPDFTMFNIALIKLGICEARAA